MALEMTQRLNSPACLNVFIGKWNIDFYITTVTNVAIQMN